MNANKEMTQNGEVIEKMLIENIKGIQDMRSFCAVPLYHSNKQDYYSQYYYYLEMNTNLQRSSNKYQIILLMYRLFNEKIRKLYSAGVPYANSNKFVNYIFESFHLLNNDRYFS